MKLSFKAKIALAGAAVVACLLPGGTATAFPPAPYHLLYGLVRDQYGTPITAYPADIFLETPTGVQIRSRLGNDISPGTNYRLEVPMDSGLTADLYQPTALRPFFQFKLKLQIGNTTYVPIEMTGDFQQIGQPGKETRLDLTMGVDSDGDGLPDAWEQLLISRFGGTLASIRGEDDADGDGISNRDEYLAGTYAFDPASGFRLALIGTRPDAAVMEFLTRRGRTYTILASSDLTSWSPVGFRIVTGGVAGAIQDSHYALNVRTVRVEVPSPANSNNRYFKALVQ